MSKSTIQRHIFEQGSTGSSMFYNITTGTVVDTNDPQQMGRCRVYCPALGDSPETQYVDLPWAIYVSPFAGNTFVTTRGPGVQQSEGSLAYGFWAIPKVGSQVLVFCIDGNPNTRAYFGAIYPQFTPHTMPHGRWMYDDHPSLEKTGADTRPFGPYTSTEKFIEPLANNMRQAFGNKNEPNYEWRTRAADYTVSGLDVSVLDRTYSKVADDKNVEHDGWKSTQGYQISRIEPNLSSQSTDKNYDSQTYAWTTPGFHAISMDDRQENCRIRFRTTSGHQILLDDTNERIYISTAQGNNWIEIDQAGNIDIFTTNKVNVRAQKDINFTSDETIRMHAKKGIHMYTDDEFRIHTKKDVHIRAEKNFRQHVTENTYIQTDQSTHVKTNQTMFVETGQDVHIKANQHVIAQAIQNVNIKSGQQINLQSEFTMNILSGAQMKLTSQDTMSLYVPSQGTLRLTTDPGTTDPNRSIHLNSSSYAAEPAGSAATATPAAPPNEQPAFWTNRVPDHEPWARTMTKNDFTHEPEFPYDSKEVGRVERGIRFIRGLFWRR